MTAQLRLSFTKRSRNLEWTIPSLCFPHFPHARPSLMMMVH